MGVLIIPAETAFTRTPFLACSIARASSWCSRTLGERCEDARHAAHRLVNQAGRDSYDMTTPGLADYLHRALGHMKEACDIGGDVGSVVVIRIEMNGLGMNVPALLTSVSTRPKLSMPP